MPNSLVPMALCLALLSVGAAPALAGDDPGQLDSLEVLVTPPESPVTPGEAFPLKLAVANRTESNRTIRVWSGSWYENWLCTEPSLSWKTWIVRKNFEKDVTLKPGTAWERELKVFVKKGTAPGRLSFRMVFVPVFQGRSVVVGGPVSVIVARDGEAGRASPFDVCVNLPEKVLKPGERFPARITLVNVSKKTRSVTLMLVTWAEHCWSTNPWVSFRIPPASKNFPRTHELEPGASWKGTLDARVHPGASPGVLSFRVGVNPMDTQTLYLSSGLDLHVGTANGPGFLTLYVSNQSFAVDPVHITVRIDGRTVVDREFLVKRQHNWIKFPLTLAKGKHRIEAVSDDGKTRIVRDFTLGEKGWAVVDFWAGKRDEPGAKGRQLTFKFSENPIGFR